MKNLFFLFLAGLFFLGCEATSAPSKKLNDIQVLGSHNSYKLKMDSLLWRTVFAEDSVQALQLDYGHVSLTKQLNLGLRSLELDIYHDPNGGKFKAPAGLDIVKMMGGSPAPFDTTIMLQPGLKVFHVHDFDFRSNCGTFKVCLNEIKIWSMANPGHWPIIITLNTKEEFIDKPGFEQPLLFSKAALDSIDLEILSVFEREKLILPDDIRGELNSLEEAVLQNGWGDLEKAKGKLLFVLDQNNAIMDRYIDGHSGLKDRVLFVNAPVGTAEAAFLILNDPIEDFDLIRQRVEQGYLVRTRADAGTWEARNNDYSRYEKAKASGAHVISTDYYLSDRKIGTGFKIPLPTSPE